MTTTASERTGRFLEGPDDVHVARRTALLDGHLLPAPSSAPEPVGPGAGLDDVLVVLRRQLRQRGLGLVALDEPLGSPEFVELGRRLGVPMPETDPAVQENVEDTYVLHLLSSEADNTIALRQPFGTGPLSMHSEGSGRPAVEQPRYIVLMCVDPGEGPGAQTVLVPFSAVDAALDPEHRSVLSGVRYDRTGVPRVRREQDGRAVFSYRDFQADALDWVDEGAGLGTDAVEAALRALLAAIYDENDACAVRWEPGLVAVIDNTWWFHGRSAAPAAAPRRRRHLMRVRILDDSGDDKA